MSYEYPAWCQMETALDIYKQDRTEYLEREASGLGPKGSEQLEMFNKAADSLVKGVQNLTGVEGISRLVKLAVSGDFPQGKTFELLEEHVCITFGWEALGMLSTARARFFELLWLLKNRQPCDRAKAFLQRVARCYLFRFDAECVVMCRAVLDREFRDWWKWYATTPEGAKYRGKRPADGQLWAKIHAAYHARMINEAERDAATAVRERGNAAVHERPDSGEAMEVVRQTVQVLDALEKNRRQA